MWERLCWRASAARCQGVGERPEFEGFEQRDRVGADRVGGRACVVIHRYSWSVRRYTQFLVANSEGSR